MIAHDLDDEWRVASVATQLAQAPGANERGNVKSITIVGIDEADLSRGQVSWVSPVARALMKAHQGDIVEVRAPSRLEQIEVLEIRYGDARGETQ